MAICEKPAVYAFRRLLARMICHQLSMTAPKRRSRPCSLGPLAAVERHALGVLAKAHEGEAEVGLVALLHEVEPDQAASDEVREHAADHRSR